MAPLIWGCAIVTAVVVATFLPFVPGGHDPLAVPLAAVAWALGRVGLLLVPVGALWLWVTRRQPSRPVPPAWLVRTTLGAFVLIAIVTVLVVFASSGSPLFAAATAALTGLLTFRRGRRIRVTRAGASTPRRRQPVWFSLRSSYWRHRWCWPTQSWSTRATE